MYEQRVSIGRVVRRKVVTTNASLMVWGALCDGRLAYTALDECAVEVTHQLYRTEGRIFSFAALPASFLKHVPGAKFSFEWKTGQWYHTPITKGVFVIVRCRLWQDVYSYGQTGASCRYKQSTSPVV